MFSNLLFVMKKIYIYARGEDWERDPNLNTAFTYFKHTAYMHRLKVALCNTSHVFSDCNLPHDIRCRIFHM